MKKITRTPVPHASNQAQAAVTHTHTHSHTRTHTRTRTVRKNVIITNADEAPPPPPPLAPAPSQQQVSGSSTQKISKKTHVSKPWRLTREVINEEKNDTTAILNKSRSSSSGGVPVHGAAVVFCYEADYLLDQLEQPLQPLEEVAREAVDAFRMLATSRTGRSDSEKAIFEANVTDGKLEEARKFAAQSLREAGLEAAMREALKKAPAGKWPVMHEIVKGVWCGGWAALNNNCRALQERGISRVVSVVSADKRQLPKSIVSHHLHVQAHDSLDARLLFHFPRICQFVDAARSENSSVFIHCGAGISRAPTSVAACLMWRYRLPARDALRLVKKARPSARPNINFVQQLVEWEQQVAEDRGLVVNLGCNSDANADNESEVKNIEI